MNSWIIENIGWTLINSLWQISLIAALLWIMLRLLKNAAANLRYSVAVIALFLAFILPVFTFMYLSIEIKTTQPKQPTAAKTLSAEEFNKNILPTPNNNNLKEVSSQSNAENFSSPSQETNIFPFLVGFWLLGMGIFSVRLIGGLWKVYQYKTYDISPVNADWENRFDELSTLLQIKKPVTFLKSAIIKAPVVIGWLKPVVLFPASVFLQLPAEELETILVHELAHIKRHDYLVNIIQILTETTLFYHPGIWWISAQIRAEREFSVDEFVVSIYQSDKTLYANALVNLEEILLISKQKTNVALAANGGNLMNRVFRILQNHHKPTLSNLSIWATVFSLTLVFGLGLGVYWLKSNETKPGKQITGKKIAIVYGDFVSNGKDIPSDDFLTRLKNSKFRRFGSLGQTKMSKITKNKTTLSLISAKYQNNIRFAVNTRISGSENSKQNSEVLLRNINIINNILLHEKGRIDYFYSGNPAEQMSEEEHKIEKSLLDLETKSIPFITHNYAALFDLLIETYCFYDGVAPCNKNNEKIKILKEKYLRYLENQFDSFERESKEAFGREVPQILFLTSNNINNDCIEKIILLLKEKGYEFVSLDDAISDETYIWQDKFRKTTQLITSRDERGVEYVMDELIDLEKQREKRASK